MTTLALLLVAALVQSAAPQNPAEPAESPEAAWTILQNGLQDKSSDKRAKAAHALGLLPHNARAQELAEKALADPNADVRAEAATALGEMGAASAQPKLEEALKDKELKVVVAAAGSLYTFKNPAAYDVYYALLTGERKRPGFLQSQLETLRDKKQIEKFMFQAGLGFVPFGGMGLEAWQQLTRDPLTAIRAVAAEKLATDPDPKTSDALGRACSDTKTRVRLAAVEAIAKRDDPKLLSSVSPLLYDSNDEIRFDAAATVIHLSSQSAVTTRKKRRR